LTVGGVGRTDGIVVGELERVGESLVGYAVGLIEGLDVVGLNVVGLNVVGYAEGLDVVGLEVGCVPHTPFAHRQT
jgi:hypothetical protein